MSESSKLPHPLVTANLTKLAYRLPGQSSNQQWAKSLPDSTERWNLQAVKDIRGESTEAYSGTLSTGQFVIACRGTEVDWENDPVAAIQDIISDITSGLTRVQSPLAVQSSVGKGFSSAAKQIRAEVLDQVSAARKERKPVVLTGHSLGGAIAHLLAADILAAGFEVAGLVTFGCPRVGDPAFAAGLGAQLMVNGEIQRFVNSFDLVTNVPLRTLGFRHCANPWYFRESNHTRSMIGSLIEPRHYGKGWSMFLDQRFAAMRATYRWPPKRLRTAAARHNMSAYCLLCKAAKDTWPTED